MGDYRPSLDLDEIRDTEDSASLASRDFSDDFSCQIDNPDLRLKFRKSISTLKLGAHLIFKSPRYNALRERGLVLTLRSNTPTDSLKGKLLNKVSLDVKEGDLLWSMGKVQFFDVFKVKLAAGYNLKTKSPLWHYRVTTKWNQDDHRALHKLPVHSGKRIQVVPNFDLEYSFPSVGGGSAGQDETDGGSCHLKMPRVDVVVNLDKHVRNVLVTGSASGSNAVAPTVQAVVVPETDAKALEESEIEEIPLLKQDSDGLGLHEASKTKWSSRHGVRRKEKSKANPLQRKDQPTPIPAIPAPWAQNPFKFPWIRKEQWYAEPEVVSPPKRKAAPRTAKTASSTWGLDADLNSPRASANGKKVL